MDFSPYFCNDFTVNKIKSFSWEFHSCLEWQRPPVILITDHQVQKKREVKTLPPINIIMPRDFPLGRKNDFNYMQFHIDKLKLAKLQIAR